MISASLAPLTLALLLTGMAGSVGHCLGMCGPLVILMGTHFSRRELSALPDHLLYHLGRILVYASLGFAAGMVVEGAKKFSFFTKAPPVLSILFGISIIFLGLTLIGFLRLPALQPLDKTWRALLRQVMRLPQRAAILLLGALNGFLPCGLVYSALLLASSTGSAGRSALGMIVFGLGTLPALLIFGAGAGIAGWKVRQVLMRISGVLVMAVGVQLILRGTSAWGLTKHLMLGKVMIW